MSDAAGPSWSDIADWYDELLTAGSGPHEHAVECLDRLLPAVGVGIQALDVACGQGIAARHLAGLGATVTGTDFSATMLAHARRHAESAGAYDIAWVECDAQDLAPFADDSFDLVTCQLALMDIPDLDAALASVRRVMRPSASFVFVIGHPVFLTPGARFEARDGNVEVAVSGYLREHFWRSTNPEGVRRAGNYQRTMSTYLTALANAELRIVEAEELGATGRLAEERPAYREVPMFFSARAVPA